MNDREVADRRDVATAGRSRARQLRCSPRDGERGAGLVEYALLVALIAVVCIVAVTFLGTSGSGKLNKSANAINGGDGSRCSVYSSDYNQATGVTTVTKHITYYPDDHYEIAAGPCP